ncbi:MAG: VIT domain-containing protein [Planctomycetota bacterium]|nr:VIT domain-containing protein [Planctomycetota bacterium]
MADETLDELQLRMADALSGRLAPAELAAFRAALERRPELKAEFDLLQQAAQALDGAYPEEPALGQQAWLRIEKSLGWRRAGEGGSSRLEAERFASKARASDESRAEREALESKNLALGDHETVNVGAPRGARARRRDELASARSGAPARSRWWFAAPLAAAVALVVLATRVFQPEPPSNTVATLPSGAPDAAGMEYTYVRGSRADVDDGRGLALLRRLGPVAVYEAERRAWRGVVPGERIPYGAKLRTAAGARAELGFGESRVRLDERTELSIERLDEHARVVHLAQGRVLVDAAPRGLNEPRARAFQGVRVLAAGGQLELRAGQAEVEVPAPDLALARVLKGSAQAACVSSRDSTPALVGLSEGREALLAEAAGREVMDVLATGLKARVAALSQARDRTLPAGEPAAWAADLDKPPGKAEAAVGQLVVQDADGKPAEPLGIAEFNVLAHLRGPLCLTRIDQSFENTTGRTLEGAFYFPLPPGAAIARFAMYVDDKTLVEGEVVERGKARAVYASILREKRDPALLEWMEGNVFRARVFPILPHSRKRIVLEYTQLIPAHYDTRRFVLPLVGEMTSTRPIGSLSVNVVAETLDGMPVHDLVSPSYFEATKVEGLGTPRAVARLNLRDVKPEADFVLNVAAERAGEFFSAVYAEGNEPPYLAVGFQPRPTMEQLAAAGAPKARDVLLVCETSGARSPADLAAQAKALEALLAGFNSGDRVALACADVFFTPLLPGFVPPFAAEVARARADLSARAPLGALNLGAVLEAAAEFAARHGAPERPRLVVFLGAGIPALGALDVGRLAEAGAAGLNKAGARFAGLAVGREVETLALEELARASGGIFAALRPDENLEESAFSLALGLQQPWLEAPVLRAEPDVLNEVYPARLASLRAGHEVFLAARLKEAKPFALALRAKLGGADFERRAGVQLAANLNHDPAVGRFWARARLDRLLARPSSDETRGEIVALAQTWTLMSPYTSFLVLESDAEYARYQIDRARRRPLWRDETVLALAAAPANRLIQQDGEKLESGLKGLNAKQAQDAKAGQKAERGKTHSDRNANIEAAASEPAWQPRPMNRRSLDEAGSRLRALESESQYRARAAKPAEPAAAGPGNQGGGNGARAQVDKSMEKISALRGRARTRRPGCRQGSGRLQAAGARRVRESRRARSLAQAHRRAARAPRRARGRQRTRRRRGRACRQAGPVGRKERKGSPPGRRARSGSRRQGAGPAAHRGQSGARRWPRALGPPPSSPAARARAFALRPRHGAATAAATPEGGPGTAGRDQRGPGRRPGARTGGTGGIGERSTQERALAGRVYEVFGEVAGSGRTGGRLRSHS